jgi:predicted enzyme involved in methoxymalonyl-ACP biosynthesis
MAELVNLLKEIEELLRARNNQLEGSSAAPFDNSHAIQLAEKPKNQFPSTMNRAAETSVRRLAWHHRQNPLGMRGRFP